MMGASNKWVVITGGSSGIGASLLRRIIQSEPSLNCLAVGRRLHKLEEARSQALAGDVSSDRIQLVVADVSTSHGIASIVSALPTNAPVK